MPHIRAFNDALRHRRGRVRARDAGHVQARHPVRRLGAHRRPLHPSASAPSATTMDGAALPPVLAEAAPAGQGRATSATTRCNTAAAPARQVHAGATDVPQDSPLSHDRLRLSLRRGPVRALPAATMPKRAASSAPKARSSTSSMRGEDGFIESVTLEERRARRRAICSSTAPAFAACSSSRR